MKVLQPHARTGIVPSPAGEAGGGVGWKDYNIFRGFPFFFPHSWMTSEDAHALPEGDFGLFCGRGRALIGETEAGDRWQGESGAEFPTWLCAVLPNKNKEPERRYFREQGTSSSLQRPRGNKPAGDISRPRGTSRSPPVPLCAWWHPTN